MVCCNQGRHKYPESASPQPHIPVGPPKETEGTAKHQTKGATTESPSIREGTTSSRIRIPSATIHRANPSACVKRILSDSPPLYCKVAEEEMVAYITAAYAESPPLNPTPNWLYPPQDGKDTDGDVVSEPYSPEEVVRQFRRMCNTAPGVDGLTYATWRWVDPKGAILADIYNICRTNTRVPSAWKHSTITLLHKGGEPAELKNWRTVSVQLTVYKLYAAIIAKRIASWATAMSSFSPAQKGFLAYDGCA